jgi:hypothetical protein
MGDLHGGARKVYARGTHTRTHLAGCGAVESEVGLDGDDVHAIAHRQGAAEHAERHAAKREALVVPAALARSRRSEYRLLWAKNG